MFAFLDRFMTDGGAFMWVILIVFLTGIGLSMYKFFQLKAQDINGNKFFDGIKKNVLENNVEEAINICAGSKAVLPKILRSGLKRANEDRVLIEDAVSTSIMEHTPKLTALKFQSRSAEVERVVGTERSATVGEPESLLIVVEA